MNRFKITVLMLFLAACGATGPAAGANAPMALAEYPPGIQVTAQGEAEAAPDVAIFNVGVEARAQSVEAARDAAARSQRAVLEALRAAGIADEDLQTTQLTVSPDYDYSESGRTLRGYIVTNRVEVRVKEQANLQRAIDTSLQAGGDIARLDGLRFELSDPSEVERRARSEAMEQAKAKASQLAELLGVQLGAPLSVQESASGSQPPVMMKLERAEQDAAQTPVERGVTRVQIDLSVRWAIRE